MSKQNSITSVLVHTDHGHINEVEVYRGDGLPACYKVSRARLHVLARAILQSNLKPRYVDLTCGTTYINYMA